MDHQTVSSQWWFISKSGSLKDGNGERELDLPLPKCLNCQHWPRRVPRVSNRGPNTWVICHPLPSQQHGAEWELEQPGLRLAPSWDTTFHKPWRQHHQSVYQNKAKTQPSKGKAYAPFLSIQVINTNSTWLLQTHLSLVFLRTTAHCNI